MKLTEMYENMQHRYDVDAEEERKAKDEAQKIANANKKKLKSLLEELINTVLYEIENNLQEKIYEKFWHLRRSHPRIKNLKTSLICELAEAGFDLTVCVNGYKCIYDYTDEEDDKIWHDEVNMTSKFEIVNQFKQHLIDVYNAREDSIELTLELSLNDNTVTFIWKFSGCDFRFKNDLQEILPEGAVHRAKFVDKAILTLD